MVLNPTPASAETSAADARVDPHVFAAEAARRESEAAGRDGSARYYLHYGPQDHVPAFPKGISDDTHFSELGARQVADLVAGGLKALNLPVSARVLAQRPALTRATPLGRTECQ